MSKYIEEAEHLVKTAMELADEYYISLVDEEYLEALNKGIDRRHHRVFTLAVYYYGQAEILLDLDGNTEKAAWVSEQVAKLMNSLVNED